MFYFARHITGRTMSVRYPTHLYVRVDRPLRADLLAAAEARGVNVSAVAREFLRKALDKSRAPIAETLSGTDRKAA